MAAQPLSILFDLDGTVVDSKPGILASCGATLRALGHWPDNLDIDNLIGPPLEEALALRAKLYIATSKRTVFAEQILKHVGLIDLFVGVHGSEPSGAMGRKADVVAHVLLRHELSADRCLMVGDRRQDMEGARTNGVPTVGVLWGYGDRDELESAGAMHIAARPAELIPIVEAHGRRLGGP